MAGATESQRREVARPLGSLALSCVRVEDPMVLLRAARWHDALLKVGVRVPFWITHDLGMLAVADPSAVPIGRRPLLTPERLAIDDDLHERYCETVRELSTSEVFDEARQWRLSDDLLIVVLMKVLGAIYERFDDRRYAPAEVPLPLDPLVYTELERHLGALFDSTDRGYDLAFLRHVAHLRLRLSTMVEQIDLDTLRLLGMFGAEAGAASALSMVDIHAVLGSPEANDVVNFSLDLLPSVLETKRASGEQTFSVDGYSGMTRSGSIDSLVLSELAFDRELFARRYLEKEVFYYAREKQREDERRLHYIVVDASASMRGQRAVFARGLALTLLKKLQLRGEDVYLRFFDARLYEEQHARRGRGGRRDVDVPYVLTFKGERGRNYAKVFGLLAVELERLTRREKKSPVLYVLTHAECHVPLETVERLGRLAQIYGIFLLPSRGALRLDYLPLLDTVQVVDEESLYRREARARRALDIVAHASGEQRSSTPRSGR